MCHGVARKSEVVIRASTGEIVREIHREGPSYSIWGMNGRRLA